MATINQIEIEGTVYDIEDKSALNNSSFTAEHGSSINSGITGTLVSSISDKFTASVSNEKLIISK